MEEVTVVVEAQYAEEFEQSARAYDFVPKIDETRSDETETFFVFEVDEDEYDELMHLVTTEFDGIAEMY